VNSMTGFGRAQTDGKLGKITIEVSGVNSRFLEMSVRLPRPLSALEPQIREQLASHVDRGKLTLFVSMAESEASSSRVSINKKAATAYYRQFQQLKKELKLSGDLTISDLALLPGVASPDETELDIEAAAKAVKKAVAAALKSFLTMRSREGQAMLVDMRKSLKVLTSVVSKVEKNAPRAVKAHAQRISTRIEELLSEPLRNSVRFEEEVAILAERTDINEECIRLKSHIDQFDKTLGEKGPVGRRLNFLLQEMNREANTIGSKSFNSNITTHTIALKEEMEKLREMAQNVE